MTFTKDNFLAGKIILSPRLKKWDSRKIGIAAPPIKTSEGWLLIFHGLSLEDNKYRLGAALLDLNKPDRIISRLDYPILEPQADYENNGLRPGTVFSCGAVVVDRRLFVYYGAADKVIGVAKTKLKKFTQKS